MNFTYLGWSGFAVCAALALGFWWGESHGHAQGVLETQASHDAVQVSALSDDARSIRNEIAGSTRANKEVRDAVASLETQNQNLNKELKDALRKNKSAPGGVVCRFDADSLRILAAAADRADALAAGGLGAGRTRRALPAGDAPR